MVLLGVGVLGTLLLLTPPTLFTVTVTVSVTNVHRAVWLVYKVS